MVCAALFLAATMFTVQRGVAAPALWVVQTPTSKVYLFGTVHILGDNVQWRSPELERAIAESQDLYLEIADASDTHEAAAALLKLGLDRDHPLSSLLPKKDVSLLDEQARKYGMPGELMFEPMRPWLAYMMLAVLPAIHSGGASSKNGVDLQIRKEFADAGKPIRGFETFDGQAHILADLPQATQIALLESAIESHGDRGAAFDGLVAAWQSGDADALARASNLDAMAKSPIYAPLIGDRNKAWAAALATRLKQPGTSFVAVGAAHLVGPNGVPSLLQQMGFTVSRVPIADPSPTPSPSSSPEPSTTASAQASQMPLVTPSPSPAATSSPTPQPHARLTAPLGWKMQKVEGKSIGLQLDTMWVDPKRTGVLFTAYLPMSVAALPDLDALDVFFHQGLVAAAGAGAVQPSKHIKICDGKQDAIYTAATVNTAREDIVLTMSDHVYLAQYVRAKDAKSDPTAMRALYSLCAP